MILCIHGHRPDKLGGWKVPNSVQEAVVSRLKEHLYGICPDRVLVGGDLGVPQWAGFLCKEMGIPYSVVVPFSGFSSKWPSHSQSVFKSLCNSAAEVIVVSQSGEYRAGDIYKRDTFMAKMSDQLLVVSDGSSGVTQHLIDEVSSRNKKVTKVDLPPEVWLNAKKIKDGIAASKAPVPIPPGAGIPIDWALFQKQSEEKAAKVSAFLNKTLPPAPVPVQVNYLTFKDADEAPQDEKPRATLSERLAPKRVVEID